MFAIPHSCNDMIQGGIMFGIILAILIAIIATEVGMRYAAWFVALRHGFLIDLQDEMFWNRWPDDPPAWFGHAKKIRVLVPVSSDIGTPDYPVDRVERWVKLPITNATKILNYWWADHQEFRVELVPDRHPWILWRKTSFIVRQHRLSHE